MNPEYKDRNAAGRESEQFVCRDLESRGWTVEKYGRHAFSRGLDLLISNWRDSYSRPCDLGWNPDFIVWTHEPRSPSNLFAVDVKRVYKNFDISRRALDTYVVYEDVFHLPVVIIFHLNKELFAIAAGKAAQNSVPRHGSSEGSGQPYYIVDINAMSPMERFFGPPKP